MNSKKSRPLKTALLVALLLVFGALAEATLTSALARRGKTELARTIDRWSRGVFVILFVVVAVLAAV